MRFLFSHSVIIIMSLTLTSASAAQTILSYKVEIEIDRQEKRVRGREWIRVLPGSGVLLTIPLDAHTIDSVLYGDSAVRFRTDERALTIDLPKTTAPFELAITYRVDNPRGLTFGAQSVYTGFDTCSWMICDPDPSKRAPLELRLIGTGSDWSVASGVLTAFERESKDRRRFTWTQERAYPAYLYGFVLGPLRSVSAVQNGTIVEVVSPDVAPAELMAYLDAHRGWCGFSRKRQACGFPEDDTSPSSSKAPPRRRRARSRSSEPRN